MINELQNKYSHLIAIIVVFLILYLILFPSHTITIDENSYLGGAYLVSQGDLKQSCDDFISGQFKVDNYCIFKYNIGTSLILLPFFKVIPNLLFLAPLIFTLLSFLIFYLILLKIGLNKKWIYLFAAFPSIVYISRTLLSESFSLFFLCYVLLVLIDMFAIKVTDNTLTFGVFNKKFTIIKLISIGAASGMAVLVRYSNVLPIAVLILGFFIASKYQIQRLVKVSIGIFIGALPFILYFLTFNFYLYGGYFRSGYYYSQEEVFALGNILKNIWGYLIILNIIYPFMLLDAVKQIKRMWLILLPFFATLALYLLSVNNLFQGEIIDLVTGIRFLIPVLPFILLVYFMRLENKFRKEDVNKVLKLLIPVCVLMIIGVMGFHQMFLNKNENIFHYKLDNTVVNSQDGK